MVSSKKLFRPLVLTRHPSHKPLRKELPLLPFRSVIRLGSQTVRAGRVEINSVDAVKNSSDKLAMKQCFKENNVKTAIWIAADSWKKDFDYPIVCKNRWGSRGTGNTLVRNDAEYDKWKSGRTLSNYIIERYYPYVREYRLHVTRNGCFYTCRKMLKRDVPDSQKWHRHSDNCVWILETNPLFDRPYNWSAIVDECVKAIAAIGLDIGACDVKIQSNKKKDGKKNSEPDFIILETNSAPSFGNETKERYLAVLPELLKEKANT